MKPVCLISSFMDVRSRLVSCQWLSSTFQQQAKVAVATHAISGFPATVRPLQSQFYSNGVSVSHLSGLCKRPQLIW